MISFRLLFGLAFVGTRLRLDKWAREFARIEAQPLPSTATAVKLGFFSDWREANLKSFMVRGQPSVVRFCTPHSAFHI